MTQSFSEDINVLCDWTSWSSPLLYSPVHIISRQSKCFLLCIFSAQVQFMFIDLMHLLEDIWLVSCQIRASAERAFHQLHQMDLAWPELFLRWQCRLLSCSVWEEYLPISLTYLLLEVYPAGMPMAHEVCNKLGSSVRALRGTSPPLRLLQSIYIFLL